MGDRNRGSVLFVCVENAGRSVMAEAFAKACGLEASSAGTMPAQATNPIVVQVMKEKGLDVSKHRPKVLSREMIERASLVVTMGCSVDAVCPRPLVLSMKKKLVDWGLEDPKGKEIDEVRRIRDGIEVRVKALSLHH